MNARERGREGENAACAWLEARGFRILARNFRAGPGEIDVIAAGEGVLAFIEVKSRSRSAFADLEYSVNGKKRARILETSKIFLRRNRQYSEERLRFDVIYVEGSAAIIRHLESAFTE
jgi:putative endonuclease